MDDLDVCYECTGYGDNYDENGKWRCPHCHVNKDDDWEDEEWED